MEDKAMNKLTLEESDSADALDAKTFTIGFGAKSTPNSLPIAPVDRDAERYKMNHQKRGKAIIFNNKKFVAPGLSLRSGTDADRDRLLSTLKRIGFEVKVYDDPTRKIVRDAIETLASEDHSGNDCVLIAVFSHGDVNQIHAYDNDYKPEELWEPFTANQCPTLAGKPKIFLIQACQGDQLDAGTTLMRSRTQVDSSSKDNKQYTIPNRADFVTVYSTVPGYYSWRNTTDGSWFIQSFCNVLNKYVEKKDFLSMLTIMAREVALNFESFVPNHPAMDRKKQVPLITSTLTREIYF